MLCSYCSLHPQRSINCGGERLLCSLSQSMWNLLSNFKWLAEIRPISIVTLKPFFLRWERRHVQHRKPSEWVTRLVVVSFQLGLMRVCYETQYSSVYVWKRMLFSCSEVGMRLPVSWENIIGSQYGDQTPERQEQGMHCWVLDPSYPGLLLLLVSVRSSIFWSFILQSNLIKKDLITSDKTQITLKQKLALIKAISFFNQSSTKRVLDWIVHSVPSEPLSSLRRQADASSDTLGQVSACPS